MINVLITYYALINGVNPAIAFKIARIESGMNPRAESSTNDKGLFQLNTKYYKFHNPEWVFKPNVNTGIALNTLGKLKKQCHHKDNFTYVLCYNLGMDGAKKIKYPRKHPYYRKVSSFWRN